MKTHINKYLLSIFWILYLYPVCFGLTINKRFLANGGSSCFPPITWHCQLNCPNGYKNGANNCPICQCATSSGSSGSTNAMASVQSSSNQFYSNPCNPAQRFCPLLCTYGYQLGPNGCQECICGQPATQSSFQSATNTTQLTMMALIKSTASLQTQKTTPVPQILTNPCTPDSPCTLTCPYGHLEGPNYCHYCICAPSNMRTHAPTTESTTSTVPTTTSNLPCVTGQTCNMTCQNGFVKGPNNCTWCLCAPDYLVTTAATDRPKTNNDGHVSTTPTSKNATSSVDLSNQCYTAFTICQLRCKDGFIIDQNSCTNCVCKDDVYKAGETIFG